MNIIIKNIVLIIICINPLFAQKTTEFYRWENENDSISISQKTDLVSRELTNENGIEFYELAEAYWRTKNNSIAKKMFFKIEKSNLELFSQTKLINSDISGDTTQNIYGYGSYTFNFKNKSSLYLTKILIEKKEFENALKYIELADKKYIANFNCGTGSTNSSKEIQKLYALCYEGLNQREKVISLLLPDCLNHWNNNEILVRNLKQKYSHEQLKEFKKKAIESIDFKLNETKSYAETIHNYGTPKEKIEERRYITGKGTILLFNNIVQLPIPSLNDGEIASKNDFLKEFKDSDFYRRIFLFWKIEIND